MQPAGATTARRSPPGGGESENGETIQLTGEYECFVSSVSEYCAPFRENGGEIDFRSRFPVHLLCCTI